MRRSSEPYETADSFCWLVPSPGVVLAIGVGRAASDAVDLAGVVAFATGWYLSLERLCSASSGPFSPRPVVWLSAAFMMGPFAVTDASLAVKRADASPALFSRVPAVELDRRSVR